MKLNLDQIKAEKEELFSLVKKQLGSEEKAEQWFSTPNPNFGNIVPNSLIFLGRGSKIKQFVLNAISENDAAK